MPITPFHFGVGLLAKGLAPKRVSFASFVLSQIVIDCETVYFILTRQWPLHRWCHTFVVAVPLGMMVGLGLWAAARLARRRLAIRTPDVEAALLPAIVGGAWGGATHPFLDGIMHSDIMPFRPLTEANPLLGWLGLSLLHLACVTSGVIGLALWIRRRPGDDAP